MNENASVWKCIRSRQTDNLPKICINIDYNGTYSNGCATDGPQTSTWWSANKILFNNITLILLNKILKYDPTVQVAQKTKKKARSIVMHSNSKLCRR